MSNIKHASHIVSARKLTTCNDRKKLSWLAKRDFFMSLKNNFVIKMTIMWHFLYLSTRRRKKSDINKP